MSGSLILVIIWFCLSGRFIFPSNKMKVAFSLKSEDVSSNKYIRDALFLLKREIVILGLSEKIKLLQIGQDMFGTIKSAHNYRERYDIDLVIWGEILYGKKEEKDVCDFKNLFFTYKIPPQVVSANLATIFGSDINISIVKRDWNVFELNSLPDTEKISGHLSEIVLFIMGIIYFHYKEHTQDASIILENLFRRLEKRTSGEQPIKSPDGKKITMSQGLFQKGRVLDILIRVYYNLGLTLMDRKKFSTSRFYFDKYLYYKPKDIGALSNAAFCAFQDEKDITSAKNYNEKIGEIDKYNEFYLTNEAFFCIWEKNYHDSLFSYMQLIRKSREIHSEIITKVIAFLDERKKDNPTEIAYDFAIAFINYHFMQEADGIQELKDFFKLAQDKKEYEEMSKYIENNITKKKKRSKKK